MGPCAPRSKRCLVETSDSAGTSAYTFFEVAAGERGSMVSAGHQGLVHSIDGDIPCRVDGGN